MNTFGPGRSASWRRTLIALAALAAAVPALTVGAAAAADHAARRPSASSDRPATQLAWSRFVDLDFSAAAIVSRTLGVRGVRQLSHPREGEVDLDPAISPDGHWVAFERDFPDGSSRIGVVDARGHHERLIDFGCTDPCAAELTPTWTPDGEHLLFTRVMGPFDRPNHSAASAVLMRGDLTGQRVTRFSQPGIDGVWEDYRATFAPAGYVVFLRVRNADVHVAVFRMTPDARHVRRLTPWSLDADTAAVSPAASGPSADLVVFETYGHGAPEGVASAVATVPATCATARCPITYLTSADSVPVEHFNPAWSPTGTRIAYVRFRGFPDRAPRGDIWTMRWDGRDKHAFSAAPTFEFRPAWGVAPGRP